MTAISTLVLALGTTWLARATRKLAREAGAETRANWQPVLVPDVEAALPDGRGGAPMKGSLRIGVRNVGRGPALRTSLLLWEGEERPTHADKTYRGQAPSDVVPPDERVEFVWLDFDPPKPPKGEGIHVWAQLRGMITYGDVTYSKYETALSVGIRIDGVASLIDYRFLGAAVDRWSILQLARYRLVVWIIARDSGPAGSLRKRLTHRLARVAVKWLPRPDSR